MEKLENFIITSNKVTQITQAISAVLVLLSVGSIYITQLIFQEISLSFYVDPLDARFAFSLASISYALSFLLFGPLSDKISSKTMSSSGSIGVIISLLISAYTNEFFVFLVSMFFLGFFAAAVPAAMFSYTARTAKPEKVAHAMGVMISASVVGIISGRSIVGFMAHNYSWRYSFVLYAIFIGITVALSQVTFVNEVKQCTRNTIVDMYKNALKMFLTIKTLSFFILGFFLFFGYLGITSFLTYVLKESPFNLSSEALSFLNLVGVSAVAGTTISSYLSRYFNNKKIALLCLVGVFLSITMLGNCTSIIGVALNLSLLFIMVFSVQPLVLTQLNSSIPSEQKGTASSLYLLSCLSGGGIGTTFLGYIWRCSGWSGTVMACQIAIIITLLIASYFIIKVD